MVFEKKGVPVKETLPFKQGFLITISSTMKIAEKLLLESNFKFFSTNRLNQDCAENLFATIRSRGGFNDHPSAGQFVAALKSCANFMIENNKPISNCLPDGDLNLSVLKEFSSQNQVKRTVQVNFSPIVPQNCETDVPANSTEPTPSLVLPESEQLVIHYISGFIVMKIIHSKFQCGECKENLTLADNSEIPPGFKFIFNSKCFLDSNFTKPSFRLFTLCCEIEKLFRFLILTIDIRVHPMEQLKSKILLRIGSFSISHSEEHSKLSQEQILSHYLQIRIHHYLKLKSIVLTKTQRKKRKLEKVNCSSLSGYSIILN